MRIDVHGEPPAAREIAHAREEAGMTGMTTGVKAMFFTPVPVLDIVVGLAVGAVDEAVNGGARALLRDRRGVGDGKWSSSDAAVAYAAKVEAAGRPLIQAEVEALEAQAASEGTVRRVVAVGIDAAVGHLRGLAGPR